MPVTTLLELATRSSVKYGKHITDIGPDCPYNLVREALLKIESPEQLRQLEIKSPQIIGHDGEIWLQLIKRDIPEWQNKPHEPKDPANWWKVYRKLKKQAQEDLEQGSEKLKAALDSIKVEKEQNSARLVKRRDPGPSVRQRIGYNYVSGRTGSKGASKLSLMEKIRKEARDPRHARMAVPNHELKKMSTIVSRAPQGLLEDYKRSAERPAHPVVTLRAPRPPIVAQSSATTSSERSIQEREARLKALKEGRAASKPASTPEMSLDGPSSPQTSPIHRRGLSVDFLESPEKTRGLLGNMERDRGLSPGARSPARVGSPRPGVKRKDPPSLFMSSKKTKTSRLAADLS